MVRTIKVRLTGNMYYPDVFVIRGTTKRKYRVNGTDVERIQYLFDNHPGRIYVDIENSNVELTSIKGLEWPR